MGRNFKNARNGKSMLKISKWPSLKPLALKNEILQAFEFLKTNKICMENVAREKDHALQQHFP